MNKLSKSIKILSILLNVLCWTGLIVGVFYGIISLISFFRLSGSDVTVSTFVSGITLDNIQFYSSTGGISVSPAAMRNMNLVSLTVYFLQIPLTAYGIQLLRKVLRPIIDQRPFSGTSHLLKKLGWVCLLITAIENLTNWGMLYIMEHQYRIADLFLGSTITRVDFLFEPDISFLLVAIVVFILSSVFRYGEELQQLSDETL